MSSRPLLRSETPVNRAPPIYRRIYTFIPNSAPNILWGRIGDDGHIDFRHVDQTWQNLQQGYNVSSSEAKREIDNFKNRYRKNIDSIEHYKRVLNQIENDIRKMSNISTRIVFRGKDLPHKLPEGVKQVEVNVQTKKTMGI